VTSGGLENGFIRFLIENCLHDPIRKFLSILNLPAFFLAPEAVKGARVGILPKFALEVKLRT